MNERIFETLSGKYKIALLTTYNFDLEYFDNNIFYKFFTNGVKNLTVFVDDNQLQESLKKHNTNLGIRYSVISFKMNKSFHPKVILLLDDTKAKLIVGSLNLTEKGYSHNQEIYNSFEYDKDNQENLNLIIDTYKFFINLNNISEDHDIELFDKLSSIPYLQRNDISGDIKLLTSLDKSIYEQAMECISEKINRIDIAVPFYDNEASALSKIIDLNPNTDIKLFIQNEKSTFPQKKYEDYRDKIFKFKRIICNESGNFYHGKVFRFITDKASYILYGSANCTNAALFNSFKNDGNVECDILQKGSINEYDDLFLEFEYDDTVFTSYPIDNSSNIKDGLYILDKLEKLDSIIVLIKYKEEKSDIKISINGKSEYEFSWKYIDNRIEVTIPPETIKEIGNVFSIVIEEFKGETKTSINCFFNDYDSISNYRNAEENDKNIAKKILFKNDIFINDVIDLMYKMPNNAVDVKKIKDNKKLYLDQKSETEESESDDEYIINEEILLEYKKKYEEDSDINKAFNKIGSSYFNAIKDIIHFEEDNHETSHPNLPVKINESNTIIQLNVTDEELEVFNRRKGKRIIKKIVTGISKDSYTEEVGYYDYKSYIGSIYMFFDKYTDYRSDKEIHLSDEPKKDYLFDYSDVASSRFDLSNSLLKLLQFNTEYYEAEKDDIILICIQSILQKIYSMNEYNVDDKHFIIKAQKMIKTLDKMYYIRDTYISYVCDALKLINYNRQLMSEGYASGEIEKLFDYKSINKIKNIINYSEDHSLILNNNTLLLNVKTKETIYFVNVKLERLTDELNKYFKDKHNVIDKIESFIIQVENPDVDLSNINPILSFKLIWDGNGFIKIKSTKLDNNIIEQTITW